MEQDTTKTIRIVIDSSKAVDGSAQATRALKAIEDQTKSTADIVGRLEASFDFVTKLTVFGFGIREVVGRLSEMWSGAREAAAAMNDLAEQLGVSTKFVQASEFAAAANTVSVEKMSQGYTKASQIIGQAAQGQKDAVELMNQLGVKILDAGGKLRSTESILSDSAAAILKVEDPAKRVALAMDLFGKAGAQLIPMLKDLAAGQDVMATKAQQAGAMIEEGILKQVAELKAHSEEASLKWNALVLNIGTPIATAAMEAVDRILGSILSKLKEMDAKRALADQGVLPESDQNATIANYNRTRALALDPKNKNNASIQHAYSQASLAVENMTASAGSTNDVPDAADRLAILRQQNASQLLVSGTFPVEKPDPVGASTPGVKGDGESLQRRLDKLNADAKIALAGATAAATAADQGADAVARLEDHTKNLKEVTDAYIKSGTLNKTAIDAQTVALDKLSEATRVQNALKDLALKTVGLNEQNAEAQTQLALAGQTTIEIERQVARQKEFFDAKQKGIPLDSQQLQNQLAAVDKQYALKQAIDDTAKSTQLWLAPFSTALNSVQSGFETLFENILKGGANVWQTLADTIKSIFIKLFAELAVIAVVRPILAPIVQGVFSPGAAQQLGFGPGVGEGGLGTVLGGGGGLTPGIQGGGSLGGGGLGSWLNSPIGGIGGSVTPGVEAASSSPYAFGDLSGAYGGLGGAAAPTGALGGLTWGGALGGIGSIGMGAYGLASGLSSGNAGQAIGGGLGILGGGVALLGPMLGLGAAAGPIGIGLALAASILPSVLGGGGPKIPPMPGLGYQQGTIDFSNPLNPVGSGEMAGGANAIGQSVLGLIAATGGTGIAGKLYSGTFATGTNHTWNGQQWVGQDYTQANLLAPDGSTSFIGGTGQGVSPQAAAEALTAQIFKADVLNGAIKGVSDTLLKVFKDLNVYTVQATQDAVSFSSAYDKLGKAANPVKDTIDKLNVSFATLSQQASTYGLSLDPINAELEKETKRTAQDFIDNMLDPLAAQMRTLDDSQQSALASAQYINDNIQGVYADTNKIVDYYNKQRLALEDQFYQGAITNLQNLIARLTYGDLANASPGTMLSGTSASYTAALAQAQAGDATAITNLPGLAETYATTARSYFASGPQYAALVDQIRQDLGNVVAVASGGATPAGSTADPQQINAAVQVQMAANDQLREVVQTQSDQIESLKNMVSSLAAQLRNIAVNM